jgi:transposase
MEQFVGLDVSQAETALCVVDAPGMIVWQGKCASTPEAISATLSRRAPHAARIALETGPLSNWHWRALSAIGLPVVCINARHARAALAMQVNKTDANDAVGLAQIVRTGWYREVRVKSERSHRTRGLLAVRAKLVEMRKEIATAWRMAHALRLLMNREHQLSVTSHHEQEPERVLRPLAVSQVTMRRRLSHGQDSVPIST